MGLSQVRCARHCCHLQVMIGSSFRGCLRVSSVDYVVKMTWFRESDWQAVSL